MVYGISKNTIEGQYIKTVYKDFDEARKYAKEEDLFFCERVVDVELVRRQKDLDLKIDKLSVNIKSNLNEQPTYYKSDFDVVDFMDSLPVRLPWLVGDTIKRIIRFEHKEPKKDLEKIKYNIERLKNDKLAQSYFEYLNEFYQRSPVNVDIWLRDFCESYKLNDLKKQLFLNIVFGELDFPEFIESMKQLENLIKD